nr:MAG TPA: hypothetical protein [Caudoviricetes sp.]
MNNFFTSFFDKACFIVIHALFLHIIFHQSKSQI